MARVTDDGGKPLIIEDANIAAFLVMKGLEVRPFIKGEGSVPVVAWTVHGERDKVVTTIKSFHSNATVGVSDFVVSLKGIRSAMYSLKSIESQ